MAVTFHRLPVTAVRRETDDGVAVVFDVPEELRPVFRFRQGQYITVRVLVDGVEHRRNYSLCSSPYHDEPLTIGVKRVQGGVVSTYINNDLRPGAVVEVYPPMGNFTKELDAAYRRHFVLLAGGSGITPLLSILKSVLRVEVQSTVTLIYANQRPETAMFSTELHTLKERFGDRFRLVEIFEDTETSPRSSYRGRLDAAMARTVLADEPRRPDVSATEYFVCGPAGMMQGVLQTLEALGIEERRIHREYFTLPIKDDATMESVVAGADSANDTIVERTVTIRLYGQEFRYAVTPDETMLSAAQRENIDPPFACQIGACCTCRAKLLSGRVRMDEREALSDAEIAEGYILTCQSHPLTDDVVADYDL